MELMSSLLLYALVVHLPQALCEVSYANHIKVKPADKDIKFNNSMMFHQRPMPKKILLNINGPPLVNMVNDLQVVFMDINCKKCIDCMERAIKAYKTHYHIVKQRPRSDELHQEVLKHRYGKGKRVKRESKTTKTHTHTPTPSTTKPKKSKSKKKTVSVTKFNVDGEVYAVKVNETNANVNAEHQNDTSLSICQLFSVTKSALCDSSEGYTILIPPRKKTTKKKKEAKPYKPQEPHFMIPSFRKRQIDNTQEPDNFMSSIEESY
ncbi:unnamed protein product [Chrysodeixis includens]|uniref:Uncharacterized protein n=1 Tax=Chrysodeixis includens TaxID=689277 RepID=A0A9P0BS79_CHRIL|nr:unnamed protein product [Chrysodeixis includens]